MPDKMVLQHDILGTIHQLKPGGRETYCGKNGVIYKKRRLSKALAHPKAHLCGMKKKCGAHE